jgi:DNA-directed RNA polymerase subunit RPC12/RpoP
MYYKCRSCGGNVVYSPEKRGMYCPFCDSRETGERTEGQTGDLAICPNCGGQVPVQIHTSAAQCPYCDSYLIFNERVEGEYTPRMIIPFQMGKEACKKSLREKFRRCLFAPTDFLSEARLDSMQGIYVPYWFYDYQTDCSFQGEGTKIKVWRSGDKEYTETSVYAIGRRMSIEFEKIPVDASEQMPDDVMELIAPFQYGQMADFDPKFMSGFWGEKYNMTWDVVENRARTMMNQDAAKLLRESYGGYSTVKTLHQDIQVRDSGAVYGLLPVWKYIYSYKGQEYPFYVNGQTGKIVGTAPFSSGKFWAYVGTLWGSLTVILALLQVMLGLL